MGENSNIHSFVTAFDSRHFLAVLFFLVFLVRYLINDKFPSTLSSQICAVHSVHRGPTIAEYSVSGTSYAPEGMIFGSSGLQVLILFLIVGIIVEG